MPRIGGSTSASRTVPGRPGASHPPRTCRPGRVVRTSALAAATAAALAGCGGDPPPPPLRPQYDLHHPSGSVRAQAASVVALRHDTSQVPGLIAALDDDDEAVRLSADAALREITGHDTGYKPYLPRAERRRHVELWRAWWEGRGRSARPVAPAPPPPPPATVVAPGKGCP